MSTVLKIGPADHGRPLTLEEFLAGDYAEGYKYELIDGKLYVSPQPNLPENLVERWLDRRLSAYADAHPEVINFVTSKARVFVPRRKATTTPEPDLAAYRDFPLDLPDEDLRWQDYSPVLVAEVLSGEDEAKDLVRNVQLYLQVPSIKEYWVLDIREGSSRLTLHVHRRYGKRWRTSEHAYGDTYTTKMLPGFELTLVPRR
jgi:Uma2 family endonuclease